MPYRLCLLGLPSSGKGTYGSLLSKALSVPLLTASTFLKERTAVDANLKAVVDSGRLVPDEVISGICHTASKQHLSFILDGYPRTAGQAKDCTSWKQGPVSFAVLVDVPIWVVKMKMSGRLICPECGKGWNNVGISEGEWDMPVMLHQGQDSRCSCGCGLVRREDDIDSTVVEARLKNYEEKTAPVIDFFEDRDMLIKWRPYNGIDDYPNLEKMVRSRARIQPA